mmetsp:Transcript_165274/g.525215  ORF Transcript_165274/g.525215 Transcript_165274/m.525215 type:complete len:573 (-) Transcript_165274:101-1819(-)
MGYTAYKGVEAMAKFNNALTSVNMLLILLVIVGGVPLTEAGNYHPMLPNGIEGVQRAAALSFFAMLGFDAATSLAEETLEPEKELPRAILWTVAITTALYMAISLVFCGLVTSDEIDETAPLAHAFRMRGAPILATVIAVGAVGNTATTLLGSVTRLPRFMLRMASDGHLPKALAAVDSKTASPTKALGVSLVAAMFLSTFVSFTALVQMASVGGLIGFSLVNASVLLVRCRPLPAHLAAPAGVPRRLPSDEAAGVSPSVLGLGSAPPCTEDAGGMAGSPSQANGDDNGALPAEGGGQEEADDVQILSRWIDPPDGIVRLASLIFAFFCSSLVFNFSLTLRAHPALVLGSAFVTAVLAGWAGRCFEECRRHVEEEEARRIFLTPCLPWLPLFAMVCNNFIIANLPVAGLIRFILLEVCVGSCVYFARLGVRSEPLRKLRRKGVGAVKRRRMSSVPLSSSRAYAEFDLNDDDDEALPCESPRVGLERAAESPGGMAADFGGGDVGAPVFSGSSAPVVDADDPFGDADSRGAQDLINAGSGGGLSHDPNSRRRTPRSPLTTPRLDRPGPEGEAE